MGDPGRMILPLVEGARVLLGLFVSAVTHPDRSSSNRQLLSRHRMGMDVILRLERKRHFLTRMAQGGAYYMALASHSPSL